MSLAAELESAENEPTAPSRQDRGFFWWGAGGYLVVTAGLLAMSLRRTGGVLVYGLDDPAIHMSLAQQLAENGTWGVEPGVYQSASSSPVWTLLIGLIRLVAPPLFSAGPLILAALSALWAIAVMGADQRVFRPGIKRPLDAAAVVVLTTIVLFLPALTMLGMEHVLHIALSLSVVALFARRFAGRPTGWPRWLPYVLLAVSTLVRFETAFLALGLGLACLVVGCGDERRSWRDRIVDTLLIGTSSAVPLIAFSSFNKAMGQGWLPNSVLAKGQVINGDGSPFGVLEILNRLTTDPLLAACTVVLALAMVVGWGRRRYVPVAIAVLVAVACHVAVADVGWYDRYQAYLIAIAVLALLLAATELLDDPTVRPPGKFVAPSIVLIALLMCSTKIGLTREIPNAVDDTFEQRYQVARFLEEFYDGEPVATGELGYVSLFHDGPVTDLLGLGDFEVLEARRDAGQKPPKSYWRDLAEERGFKVAAVYPFTLWTETPDEWILVGTWKLDRRTVTAFQPEFQFWATRPEEVAPLQERLREFESKLPDTVTTELDPLATYRADQLSGS